MQRSQDAAAASAHDEAVALAKLVAAETPSDFPAGLQATVRDSGGEISASVEETNR